MSSEAVFATPVDEPVRRRWWTVPLMLVGSLVVCVVAVWWYLQRSELRQRYRAIRAAGQPVTLEELDAYYALPAGVEDITELWVDALSRSSKTVRLPEAAKLPLIGDGPAIPAWGEEWAEKDQVATFLDNHSETLTAIHQAAAADGGVRYPHDLRDGVETLLPHVQNLRSSLRLLTLEAHIRARNADAAGAIESLRGQFAVGRTLDGDPLLVSFLVRLAVDGGAVDNASQLLPGIEPTREQLLAIQDDLRRTDYHAELENALIGERVFGLSFFGNSNLTGLGAIQTKLLDISATGSKVKFIDMMGEAMATSRRPWQEGMFNEPWLANWNPNSMNPIDQMYSVLIPELDRCFLAGGRQEASRLSLDAAIAAELYRRDHGKLPESLEDLVPDYLAAVPKDPFNGELLRYVVNENDFVIYGLGEDLNDDSGSVEEQPSGYPLDVGVRWIMIEPLNENP